MIDKNLFIQDLKYVYTVLQELKVNEEMIKQLIDKYNLTEENLDLTNTELEEIKTYIDSIKEFIVQNNITTEIGGNLEVDGSLTTNSHLICNSDVSITGELSLPSYNNLVFDDGSTLDNKVKLVATGKWNTQYKYFDLNTVLESNKIYMGKIIGGSETMFFIAIYPNNYYFSTPTTIIDTYDSIFNVSLINYEKMTSNTSILQPLNNISDNIQTNDSYLEVEIYELPFIFN